MIRKTLPGSRKTARLIAGIMICSMLLGICGAGFSFVSNAEEESGVSQIYPGTKIMSQEVDTSLKSNGDIYWINEETLRKASDSTGLPLISEMSYQTKDLTLLSTSIQRHLTQGYTLYDETLKRVQTTIRHLSGVSKMLTETGAMSGTLTGSDALLKSMTLGSLAAAAEGIPTTLT